MSYLVHLLDPEGSLSATTVVVLLLTGGVVTRFRKMSKAVNTQRKVTKLRIHIRDIIPDRSTILDFFTRWRHLPGP